MGFYIWLPWCIPSFFPNNQTLEREDANATTPAPASTLPHLAQTLVFGYKLGLCSPRLLRTLSNGYAVRCFCQRHFALTACCASSCRDELVSNKLPCCEPVA
jgi:hypothetical protein